jgi:hypothetical protein
MKIVYTDHTRARMKQRNIREDDITATLRSPDDTYSSFGGRECARKMIRGRELEVIYVKENDQRVVITTYWVERD